MGNKNQQQEKSKLETPEELVSLAQEYFSHEFPTSDRNCPSPGELAKLIKSGELPDDALREHLLVCSRCFLTYTEGLQRSRDTQPAVGSLRLRITELLHKYRVRVLVASLPVLSLIVLAVFYFVPKNLRDKATSGRPPVEVVNANANVRTITPPSPVQIDPSTKTEEATHVARIDLRNYSPQRGSETGEEPPPVRIKQIQTTVTITLPEDSPAGTYSVSIVDGFGKLIKNRHSYTADGKKLTVTVNLDNLRNQKYRLCVSRSGEPPNCYPILITSRGKKPQ